MSQQRLLAAIMFTDIEGYTSLMQRDEAETILIRNRHREAFKKITAKHNGHIVQYFGDGTLSTFKSTVEAVDCAIELQMAFLKEPKIPIRIGIHVGDIVYSKDDIIGDAVNVASRIESCALPGSILISDRVHDQIRSHSHIETKFLDAFELKNVNDTVPIFAISNKGLVIPKKETIKEKLKASVPQKKKHLGVKILAALMVILALVFTFYKLDILKGTIPAKDKSIAVLPFDNLSDDHDAEIFRDGMTDDILTNLSKIKDLHVISRNSVMGYKDTNKSLDKIAKELGVSYVLVGSILKYGNDVRINTQLIEVNTDKIISGNKYDVVLTDIFKVQSEVSQKIVEALDMSISFEEQKELSTVPIRDIEAYKLFLMGKKEADKRNSESLAKSIELYEKAIEIDPNYAEAYAEIANSIYLETYYSSRDPQEASSLANEYLDKAEKINNKVSRIYSVKGLIYNIEGKKEEAQAAFEKAIALSPNDLTARHQYSTFFYYNQEYEKQLEQAEIAYRLDPLSFATASGYFTALMSNYKYHEAEQLMKKIQKEDSGNNEFVINRNFFRLYMDQEKYNEAIVPLRELVKKQNVFNRFLGYCYTKVGDTVSTYRIIDSIRKNSTEREKSHQLAVVYSSLKQTDSVLFYLDTIRNKQTRTFKREQKAFFDYLQDDPRFIKILKDHGIQD
ncbi:adenylate/guanylate cyclase domain-containing protein [Hanstruepera ponticola]|uniref:adenylate/guanylate cyclase domain-containing protein n=1 Tax=Hanstruepera ponticola TaxID=2042995 RepID=UPI000CF0B65B|nr:FlgO family outer membrane protein [Hanstruepera ponticola]